VLDLYKKNIKKVE